ncbi:MAG: cell division protein ZapE [Alphaproteobacteria bacterium]
MTGPPLPAEHKAESVSARYAALAKAEAIGSDEAQFALALRLDGLAASLGRISPRRGRLARLFGRPAVSPPRGMYIWGSVGSGKSMLMDMFFAAAPCAPKRRVHFNAFMADVHARLHALNRSGGTGDPIAPTAKALAREARLLCFDEFMVTNIADAMILGRLFEALLGEGVVVVATSNEEPRRLYEGGINRQLFLPFIALIEDCMDVVRLDARTDFRLEKLAGAPIYLTPSGPEASAALAKLFTQISGAARGAAAQLDVLGRALAVPQAAGGVARFAFDDLCAVALGAIDYLAVARRFHTVIVDGVPVMSADRRDRALRFVALVDTLYDARVKLILSADAEPHLLCRDADLAAFARTASRLVEMRSEAYLSLPLDAPVPPDSSGA